MRRRERELPPLLHPTKLDGERSCSSQPEEEEQERGAFTLATVAVAEEGEGEEEEKEEEEEEALAVPQEEKYRSLSLSFPVPRGRKERQLQGEERTKSLPRIDRKRRGSCEPKKKKKGKRKGKKGKEKRGRKIPEKLPLLLRFRAHYAIYGSRCNSAADVFHPSLPLPLSLSLPALLLHYPPLLSLSLSPSLSLSFSPLPPLPDPHRSIVLTFCSFPPSFLLLLLPVHEQLAHLGGGGKEREGRGWWKEESPSLSLPRLRRRRRKEGTQTQREGERGGEGETLADESRRSKQASKEGRQGHPPFILPRIPPLLSSLSLSLSTCYVCSARRALQRMKLTKFRPSTFLSSSSSPLILSLFFPVRTSLQLLRDI